MSHYRLPPPAPACLSRPCWSKQKGGTLIVAEVADRATHERRCCSPDGYRPEFCPGCGHRGLHVHDYRDRLLDGTALVLVRYWCPGCGATWRMLPGFVARLLRRTWPVVEAVTLGPPPSATAPRVPARTVRRWRARLAAAAWTLVQLLRAGVAAVASAVRPLGRKATRRDLVVGLAQAAGTPAGLQLATAAALLHDLQPGARLM